MRSLWGAAGRVRSIPRGIERHIGCHPEEVALSHFVTMRTTGGTDREQGISKAGNRRLRTVMIELAWLWQRYQTGSAEIDWFRARVSGTGARMRKVMVVALARKLLIALWRFVTQGVIPGGAVMKPAS